MCALMLHDFVLGSSTCSASMVCVQYAVSPSADHNAVSRQEMKRFPVFDSVQTKLRYLHRSPP
jgi:hypothetical protein